MTDRTEIQEELQELSDEELKSVAGGSDPTLTVHGGTKVFDDTTYDALKK